MHEQRFRCTACGQCCYGWVPLTVSDALAHAGRFPLAMVWTIVPQTSRSFELTTRLGTVIQLPNRKKVAVLMAPTLYIPPSFPCPALSSDNLCTIHEDKPLRCRTMPFYPYREETDQADLLVPRKGWLCDVSEAAPVVYRDKVILDRENFDQERDALLINGGVLRAYAEALLKQNPAMAAHVIKAARQPVAARVVMNFSPFLRHIQDFDLVAFARAQYPVLMDYEQRVTEASDLEVYRKHYHDSAEDLVWFYKRSIADPVL